MQLTWFGHSNFKIDGPERSLLIDPFFEGNPKSPTGPDAITDLDAVLITHDHADHVGQAVDICKRTGAQLVGVFDTVNELVSQGLPAEQGVGMNIGGTVEVAGVQAKMVQAVHSTRTGAATGYILTFDDGFCLYHAGDTALFMTMKLFKAFHDIDLAILPIGGHFTMDARAAAYACSLLGCSTVVPMHWGTFPVLEQNTDTFAGFLQEFSPETGLMVLEPGKPVKIG